MMFPLLVTEASDQPGYKVMQERKNCQRGDALSRVADKVWLTYFNEYLYSTGAISQEKRRKIEKEIDRLYKD